MQQQDNRRPMVKGASAAPQAAKRERVAEPVAQKAKPPSSFSFGAVVTLALGAGAIVVGQYLQGGDIASLLQHPSALLIGPIAVIGGTVALCASKLGTMLRDARKALRGTPTPPELIERIVKYCSVLRVEGPNALQAQIRSEACATLATGLTLIVSNISPEAIKPMLERASAENERQTSAGAEALDSTGRYLLTFGILGSLLGILYSIVLTTDPAKVATGIATAVVAAMCGAGLASFGVFPIAKRMRLRAVTERQLDKIAITGVNNICAGMSPVAIKELLTGGGKPAPKPAQAGPRGRSSAA